MIKLRFWLKKLHLYLAVLSALPLLIVSLSGSILVFQDPLDVWINSDIMTVEASQKARLDFDAIHRAAKKQLPDVTFRTIHPSPGPNRSIELWSGSGETWTSYYFDPYSGRLLGSRRSAEWTFRNALPIIVDPHYSLRAGETGRYIVGIAAIVLVFSALTGLVLWMPRNLQRLGDKFALRKSRRWKQTAYTWHSNLGFYFVPLLLGIGVSGATFTFHESTQAILDWMLRSPPPKETPSVPRSEQPTLGIEELFTQAERYLKEQYGYVPARMQFNFADETEDNAAVRTRFQGIYFLYNTDRYNVWLNPYTGQVIGDKSPPNFSRADDVMAWVGTLHFGYLGDLIGPKAGLFTRLLWSFAALMPLFLAITGFWFWKKSKLLKIFQPSQRS